MNEPRSAGRSAVEGRTVRDPLWQNIRLDAAAAAIVDTPEFQRLRRVKQLGFAHLVYPGAIHTRFLHALGVHHLTGRAIDALRARGELAVLDAAAAADVQVVRLAALLHDVGHYPFSHAMEELEASSIPGHHEEGPSGVAADRPRHQTAERPRELVHVDRNGSGLQVTEEGAHRLDRVDAPDPVSGCVFCRWVVHGGWHRVEGTTPGGRAHGIRSGLSGLHVKTGRGSPGRMEASLHV